MARIYFAAPMFCRAEIDFNLNVANLLRSVGHIVFLPQEGQISITPDMTPEEKKVACKEIFTLDLKEIEECDILLFVMDGRVPDEGACFELGYAFAKNKKLVGLKTDDRVSEKGGDNIMLSVPLEGKLAGSVPELLMILEGM